MEVRDSLALDEHSSIDALERSDGLSLNQMLNKASLALSGLSKCASLVMAPTEDLSVNYIEFVPIQDKQICRAELDSLTSDLVERGVAIWSEHADTARCGDYPKRSGEFISECARGRRFSAGVRLV
jgi:hypothetical protein